MIFLPTPSARRATSDAFGKQDPNGPFLPTPSARRATRPPSGRPSRSSYFYPRPPRGGRQKAVQAALKAREISTHALREEGDDIGSG